MITRHVAAFPRVPGSTPGRAAVVDEGHLLRLTGSLSVGDISTSSFTPASLDVVTCRANLSALKWQTAQLSPSSPTAPTYPTIPRCSHLPTLPRWVRDNPKTCLVHLPDSPDGNQAAHLADRKARLRHRVYRVTSLQPRLGKPPSEDVSSKIVRDSSDCMGVDLAQSLEGRTKKCSDQIPE